MSTMRSQDEIRNTVVSLGLPEHPYYLRRAARALDIVNKVHFLGEGVYRVDSQFDDKHYHTELNHGNPGCPCEDFKKNGVACKHMIAATIYQKEAKATQMIIRKRSDGVYGIIDGNHLVQVSIMNNKLFCNCSICRHSKQQADCKYKKAIRNNGGGTKITNECGSNEAQALQSKLNAQMDSHGNNGNGAQAPSQPQLDISDPFQECEQLDIDQIEGRSNGELVHKLSNGEYVISYQGIMTLSEKHHIEFSSASHDDTHTVIAKGRCGTSERVSGKPVNGNETTAIELAKRNAARQLLPLGEIKAIEKKVQLENEFDWQKAKAKCVELVGTDANMDIIIHELVDAGKLRQDNPSHYDRTEWLIIHDACKQDASNNNNDGGDNTPSSTVDIPPSGGEVVADEIQCAICSRQLTNPTSRRFQIGPECRKKLGITGLSYLQDENVVSSELADASKLYHEEQFQKWIIRACLTLDAPLPVKVLRWLGNEWFGYRKSPILYYLDADGQLNRLGTYKRKLRHKVITHAETELDSHAVRIASETNGNGNGGRTLQMDRKLRTWLIEAEGTKKEISCREIAEQFDDGSIITRLRAGIDDGADISIVELDD